MSNAADGWDDEEGFEDPFDIDIDAELARAAALRQRHTHSAGGGSPEAGRTLGGTCPLCGEEYSGHLPDHLPCDTDVDGGAR